MIDKRREELLTWLKKKAPGLCELYEGALRLVFDNSFPGRYRLVAHAVREIRNRLPDVISWQKEGERVDYPNRIDNICRIWERTGFPFDGTIPQSLTHGSEIPKSGNRSHRPLFKEIASLLEDHKKGRARNKEKGYRLFEGIAPENQKIRSLLQPIVEQWDEVFEWFMSLVHEPAGKEITVNEKGFLKHFFLFETTLMAFVGGFDQTLEDLDEILKEANTGKAPTADMVDKVVASIGHLEARRYFIERLENTNWIAPLKSKGFFKTPPTIRDAEGKTIGFPPWPESHYLARMAKQAPNAVLEVAFSLTETENVLVHADLIDAALFMPTELAAQFSKKEIEWLKKQPNLFILLPDKYGTLILHLARGEQVGQALRLAEALLDIRPDERYNNIEELHCVSPEPRAKLDSWHY
jgi:hypothetical protein